LKRESQKKPYYQRVRENQVRGEPFPMKCKYKKKREKTIIRWETKEKKTKEKPPKKVVELSPCCNGREKRGGGKLGGQKKVGGQKNRNAKGNAAMRSSLVGLLTRRGRKKKKKSF